MSVVPDFHEKYAELCGLLQSQHAPPRVKAACFCLSERQKELFFWVPEIESAVGAPRLLPGLHASDFLCELIEAFRALDWPKVLVLVQGGLPIDEGPIVQPPQRVREAPS